MKSVAEIFHSYAVLDESGRHTNGCDKQSNHNYGDVYDAMIQKAFGDLRHIGREYVELMMEVGIADGSSLRAWRDIFPNAHIVGMDIHPSVNAVGDHIEFHLGDATWRTDCDRATNGRLFDMIVDDATHHLADLLRTLLYLWPSVKPGGIYVIEEFQDASSLRKNILEMWPFVQIIGTRGPHIEDEPLVVLTKPRSGL